MLGFLGYLSLMPTALAEDHNTSTRCSHKTWKDSGLLHYAAQKLVYISYLNASVASSDTIRQLNSSGFEVQLVCAIPGFAASPIGAPTDLPGMWRTGMRHEAL